MIHKKGKSLVDYTPAIESLTACKAFDYGEN